MQDREPTRTVLYQRHVELGARMVPFGGWSMPVQYAGISQEHETVRSGVGLFDVSHMGQFGFAGPEAGEFLDLLLPGNVRHLQAGEIIYTPICNPNGGVIDDALLYRLEDSTYKMVVNAARTGADWDWIVRALGDRTGVKLEDAGRSTGMLAVQGPDSQALLSKLGISGLADLSYYTSRRNRLDGAELLISRSGYTGEDGFEIVAGVDDTVALWDRIVEAGAKPCGLGARDTLRTEMGYCLYGRELGEQVSPLEAGIGWTIDLGKEAEFIGKRALAEQKAVGVARRLRGLRMKEKGIPRAEQQVISDDRVIGRVTSGTFSPSLQCGIALAFLESDRCRRGSTVYVDIRGRMCRAEVVRPPFVPSRVKRNT